MMLKKRAAHANGTRFEPEVREANAPPAEPLVDRSPNAFLETPDCAPGSGMNGRRRMSTSAEPMSCTVMLIMTKSMPMT